MVLPSTWQGWTIGTLARIMRPVPDEPPQTLYTVADLADLTGLTTQRIRDIIREGRGPRVAFTCRFAAGRPLLLFLPREARAWAEERRRR